MANALRYAQDPALATNASHGVLYDAKKFVEGAAFAVAITFLGFTLLTFVLVGAVVLSPLIGFALAIACARHDVRARRATGIA